MHTDLLPIDPPFVSITQHVQAKPHILREQKGGLLYSSLSTVNRNLNSKDTISSRAIASYVLDSRHDVDLSVFRNN